MFGVMLAGVSSALEEIAVSIGKRHVNDGKQSFYTFGFLIQFFSMLLIFATGFLLHHLTFSTASLPTL